MRPRSSFLFAAVILLFLLQASQGAGFKIIRSSVFRGIDIVKQSKTFYSNSIADVRDCRFYVDEKEELFSGKRKPAAVYKKRVHFWLHNRLYRSKVRTIRTTFPREMAYGFHSQVQPQMISLPCLFDPRIMWRQKYVKALGVTKIGTVECNVVTFAEKGIRYYAAISVREPKVMLFTREGRILVNGGKGYERVAVIWQRSPSVIVSWSRSKKTVPVLKNEVKEIFNSKGKLLERITYSYSDYIIDKGIPKKLLK